MNRCELLLVISLLAVALTAMVACGDGGELDDANARIAELEGELNDTKAALAEAQAAATVDNRLQLVRDRGTCSSGGSRQRRWRATAPSTDSGRQHRLRH